MKHILEFVYAVAFVSAVGVGVWKLGAYIIERVAS